MTPAEILGAVALLALGTWKVLDTLVTIVRNREWEVPDGDRS